MAIWAKLSTKASLSSSLQSYLRQVRTGRIIFYEGSTRLTLVILGPDFPLEEDYPELIREISALYPVDVDLLVIPSLGPEATPQGVPMGLFSQVLAKVSPAYSRWRNGADWQVQGNRAKLLCSQELIYGQLEKKQLVGTAAKTWNMMTSVPMSFDLGINEDLQADHRAQVLKDIGPKSIYLDAPPPKVPTRTGGKATSCRQDILLGKTIKGNSRPIGEIEEEENGVVVSGEVFEVDVRELKSGRSLFIFSLTDQTDSISCKFFSREGEGDKELEDLKQALVSGAFLKVRGQVRSDDFAGGELTLMCRDIMHTQCPVRRDEAEEKRVELHLHTKMSPMDGVSSLASLVKLAKDLGHDTMAVTDHGVVQAFPEAYELGKKHGVKIIYGMEAYIFDDALPDTKENRSYHCVILAKTALGLRNLYRLVTESHLRYFKRRPRIPKRLLAYAREGLVIGSACEAGELIQHYLKHPEDDAGLESLASFYDYIEIQPLANNAFMIPKKICKNEDDLRAINQRLWDLGQSLNKPVVATCDVHFANYEDAVYRGILMAGMGFGDADDQPPLYYRTTEEMLACFDYLGEAEAYEAVVTNPRAIVADFDDLMPMPDHLHPPVIPGAEEEIIRLTMDRAHALYGEDLPPVIEARITKELDAIIGNGFAVLYLISHKLVKKSREDGYMVGSRGSVGSSLVAFLTGITEVNALPPHYRCPQCRDVRFAEKGVYGTGADMPDGYCSLCGALLVKDGFDIPFEIFLGFKGDKVPDIDLNFSGEYQPHAHAYTEDLFGVDNVFRAGTISTVATKTAYGFVSKYFEERSQVKRRAEINRLCLGCAGVKRTTGQHPGGLMVIPQGEDVHTFTPLQRPADDVKTTTTTTHFDYHAISERLVKLDILGHDDPTVIKMLEDMTGVDAGNLPLDDPETLSLFSGIEALGGDEEALRTAIGTYGIPEFNTSFVRQMLSETKPKCFADLIRISGYSHGTNVWLNNARDLIQSGSASVSETISTRDDIMNYLSQKGMEDQTAFEIMERVRKGRGLTPEHISLMESHAIPEWFIGSCEKIKYLFPKAHAVAYVMMAFRIAWFKINYPLAFYASYFSVRGILDFDSATILKGQEEVRKKIDDFYKLGRKMTAKEQKQVTVLEVALEMYVRGYAFLPICHEKSSVNRFILEDGKIRIPLMGVSGLGETMAKQIVKAREERPFISVEDLQIRGKVGDAMVAEMQALGMLQDLPEGNQIPLF